MFNDEPKVNPRWDSDLESLNSHLVKQDHWRSWYLSLSHDKQIEYLLKYIDQSCLNNNNTNIQALIKIKGEKYVENKYGIKKMSSLQQTFDGF